MVKSALIVVAAALALAGCGKPRPAVVSERPVEVLIRVPAPCVNAADRRPRPSALADKALPSDPRIAVAVLLSKLKEFYPWSRLADAQLDACTRK